MSDPGKYAAGAATRKAGTGVRGLACVLCRGLNGESPGLVRLVRLW